MIKAKNTHGLVLTCPEPEAAQLFDGVVRSYLAFRTETGTRLKTLLRNHPGMPMANCLRGYFLMLLGVSSMVPRALAEAEVARACGSGLEPREGLHLKALDAWARGSLSDAAQIWDAIGREYPRDLLALKMAHFGHFYTGRSRRLRDSVARALDFWGPADPEYSFLCSMYAFALEECGEYAEAEKIGRNALDRNPDDPWGIHAVAHVFEATGRFQEGVTHVTEMEPNWKSVNNFRYHVAWHRALFHYEAGDASAALAAFDADVFEPSATEDLDLCNDASLLLRIEMGGVDVGDRWAHVAAKAEARGGELLMPFYDVHAVLALASSPDPDHRAKARALTARMRDFGEAGVKGDAATYRDVGAALAEAILEYRSGKSGTAWSQMEPVLERTQAIGGSHAQRDLFWKIAADALRQSEPYSAEAVAFYGARTRSRPQDGWNWARYLEALETGGQDEALHNALVRHKVVSS